MRGSYTYWFDLDSTCCLCDGAAYGSLQLSIVAVPWIDRCWADIVSRSILKPVRHKFSTDLLDMPLLLTTVCSESTVTRTGFAAVGQTKDLI